VEPSQSTVRTKSVSIRQVYWTFPSVNCPGCGGAAQRVWDVTRVAVDIDLDQPIVLAVEVSVHVCSLRPHVSCTATVSSSTSDLYAARRSEGGRSGFL
jgi:ArsR family metal-binding transcriptional regulator